MRKIVIAIIASAAFATGSLVTSQTASAANVDTKPTPVYTQPATPGVQPLDCNGGTGTHGCGPGWHWRDGWRGWACYVC
jgi:hypothetical protein